MNISAPIVLASGSPRRKFLLEGIGIHPQVVVTHANEDYPEELPAAEVAPLLAKKKAAAWLAEAHGSGVVAITADTVVMCDKEILNKPADTVEAHNMLARLSGRTHAVMTGFCITSPTKQVALEEVSHVTFRTLTSSEIDHYITHFKPFDKAGAYGAQECLPPKLLPFSSEEEAFLQHIGHTTLMQKSIMSGGSQVAMIEQIEGSYFNVMGLPVHKVYDALIDF